MMKIFRIFTRKSLATNKTKTIVTIIGIILSVSLFTAVAEGLVSALHYGMALEKKTGGAYEAGFEEVDNQIAVKAGNDDETDKVSYMKEIGYSYIGSENEAKPYLYIAAVDENFPEMTGVRLTEGRLPKNSSEILIPNHLKYNGNVEFSLGDTINVEAGKRKSGTDILSSRKNPYVEGEELVSVTPYSYMVVGFYERLDYSFENYECPGYTALTFLDKDNALDGNFYGNVYVTLKHPRKVNDYINNILSQDDTRFIVHTGLLMFYGITYDSGLLSLLYGFAAILFLLIMFGSISLIYNSFSISVSERTKQFGLLKSIGATKKQIMGTVLYEAVFLSAIAIPIGLVVGCVGIGTTLYLLRDTFGVLLSYEMSEGIAMSIHIEPAALIIIALIGFLTTLISAFIPAIRAIRIMPIDSLRQSGNIKVRANKVKTSKLVYRIFGFEGMIASKNFKRSRKKYRVTVMSLFVSVVLFISVSAYSDYLVSTSGIMSEKTVYDMAFMIYESDIDYDMLTKRLSEIDNVKSLNRFIIYDTVVNIGNEYDNQLPVCFVNDRLYYEIAKKNDIDIPDDKKYYGLIQDEYLNITNNGEGTRWSKEHILDDSKEADSLECKYIRSIPGYTFEYNDNEYDDEGNVINEKFYYCDAANDSENEKDYVEFSKEEAYVNTTLNIAGKIDSDNKVYEQNLAIIFPDSARDTLFADAEKDIISVEYDVLVEEYNNNVYDDAKQILEEMYPDAATGYSNILDSKKSEMAMMKVINVFAFGFIILISLIAVANVFNTISTNVMLRRRELAMLKSVGMSDRGMKKMMNYECVLYGVKGLMYGIPVSVVISYLLYNIISDGVAVDFYIPWYSICISVVSVFVVVFVTMIYSVNKIKKDNTIDALKNENI